MEGKKNITYTWNVTLPQSYDKWIPCGAHPSKVIENCDISLQLLRVNNHDFYGRSELKALISKSNLESTKVVMVLKVPNINAQSVSLDHWKNSHEFNLPNHTIPSSFSISCDITWYCNHLFQEPKPFNLHDEIKLFHLNPMFSDVTIVIGNEELPVHKMVLAACSSVFLSMLNAPMKETKENRIVIKDVQIEIMKTILKFLYEGNTTGLEVVDTALKVLAAAEKYDMKKLKEICEYKLYKKLTVANVLNVLREADTHEAHKLRQQCLNFITTHKKQIIEVASFDQLCHDKPTLMCDFIKKVIRDL